MKSSLQAGRLFLAIHVTACFAGMGYAATGIVPPGKSAYPKLPLYFEANRGQVSAPVKFLARGPSYRLFLTSSEATLVLLRDVIHIHLKGGHSHPLIEGQSLLPGKSNYFIGNDPQKWLTNVAQYSKVAYRQVYPGIDMIYEGNPQQLEYSFIVAPGADPALIRMEFKGADHLGLDRDGNLTLGFKSGHEVAFQAPTLYQHAGNKRVPVQGRFLMAEKNVVRFEVGDYKRDQVLVIDPTLLYSTYLGGAGVDQAYAIAVDAVGNSYITGATASNPFPGTTGMFQAANAGGASDVFVTKINAAGTAVLWSTFLGGAGVDRGNGIAVDAFENVYITGSTTGLFPTSAPFQATNNGGTDAFVTAISSNGASLIYSTYLGGTGEDGGNGIAVSPSGIAYVAGHTDSAGFPVSVGAFQGIAGGVDDAFVASFDAAGARRYASFLGGTTYDHGNAIAIDSLGNAYVTGQTSNGTFPVTPSAFQFTITGPTDAFIAKVNPSGTSLLYATFLGGSGDDEATGIAVGAPDIVYVTGFTGSADFPYLFTRVGQTVPGAAAPDAFVFKLHIGNGGGLNDGVYATYLGGATSDVGMTIALDKAGRVYVSGRTTSLDFPVVNPLTGQSTLGATGKAFVTEISSTGATRLFSTYLGGGADQAGQGIALDSANNIYVAGWTSSTDFPTTVPIQAANAGTLDAFVAKISAPTPPPASPTGLTGTALGISSISWTWNAVAGATAYQIYQATSTATLVASTSTLNFIETGLSSNTAYSRVVTAIVDEESALSPAGMAYTLAATPGAGVFTNVFYTSFTVTWAANNPAGTRFEVSRSTTNDNFGTAVSTTIAFTDSFILSSADFIGLRPGAIYYLRIRAENGAVVGAGIPTAFTTTANALTMAVPAATGLNGTALGISSISWTWNAVPAASSYNIYQATSPTTRVTGISATAFIETGLSTNTAYGRVVSALINGVQSPLSPAATAYTLAATPGVGVFMNVFYTSFTVTWATNNPAGTRFEVSQSTTNDDFTTSVSTPIPYTANFVLDTANFNGLLPATTYYFRIRAENGPTAGAGMATAFSAPADELTLSTFSSLSPPPPSPPSVSSLSPISGPDSGGTEVTIIGNGFSGVTSVTFAGQNAVSFTVDSNTQITARSPAQAAGPAIDVVVSRSGVSATAGSYTFFAMLAPSLAGSGSYIFPSPADGPTATLVYTMAESGAAHIRVYNEVGNLVIKLDDSKPAGAQASTIQTAWLAPGVYFYILNLNYNSGISDNHKLKKFVVKH